MICNSHNPSALAFAARELRQTAALVSDIDRRLEKFRVTGVKWRGKPFIVRSCCKQIFVTVRLTS